MKRGRAEIPGDAQENASRHIPEDLEGGQQNSPGSTTEEKISLFPLLVVNFINALGFSIVLPFLVFLVNRFGGNAFVYGLASSMYPTFQLIGAPILGRWSDIYGRKKILILCQIGTLISWIIFLGALYLPLIILFKVDSKILGAFTFTLPLAILFFARALDGLTGGDVSIANAYLADTTSEKDRNRNFGKMSIAINLGFVVGPAFAGILSITEYGVVAPVLGAIVISFIGMVLLVLYIRESRQCSVDPTGAEKQQKYPGNEVKKCVTAEEETVKPAFREILKLPNVPYMLGLNFLIDLSYNIFYTSFPLHAIAVLGWDLVQLSLFYTILCGFIVIVQGPVLSWASKKYPDSNLIIFGSLMLGTNYLLLISGNFYLTYLATVFFALGDGLMWPSFLSLLSKVAGRKYQGTVQGFASSSGSLASIIGLILGGFLYEVLDGSVFLIAGLVIYTAFILNFRLRRFEKKVR
ncbi:MAG: hypothetical protein QG646_4647 [Euryarchaeota archaeon]|nr:hypothetical protein [Euryarchaeota archaeon]